MIFYQNNNLDTIIQDEIKVTNKHIQTMDRNIII